VVASDGAGAIEQLLDHEDISIIVSDYRMNVLGGSYWVRFLEKFCPEKQVIITSAYLDSEFNHSFPVLKKPYEFEELARRIKSMENG
jgi:CheY-like chemotaxis protein